MRVAENKGITLLYISNGIHFKLSSLSAKSSMSNIVGLFFIYLALKSVILQQKKYVYGH